MGGGFGVGCSKPMSRRRGVAYGSGGRRRGNDGRRGRVGGVDSGQNGSVESTGHGLDVEHGGEGFVRVLGILLVLEGERGESDKVVRVILSDGRVDGRADGGCLGHVYAGSEVLEEDLLVGGSGVDVDGAGADGSEGRRVAVVLPCDINNLSADSSGAGDRAGDVDTGSDGVDGERGGEEAGDGVGEDHCGSLWGALGGSEKRAWA